MKLGKIFICINILVLSLLMLTGCTEKWPRIIYQNTSYRFDEYNRTIVLDGYHFAMKRIIKNNYQPNSVTRSLTQRQKNFRYIGISNDRLAAHRGYVFLSYKRIVI